MNLDNAIRKVQNFPKPGVLFYDVTSIFTSPQAFHYVLDQMDEIYKDTQIDGIICIESRGFVLGAPFALKRSLPLVLARKKGKLPGATISKGYTLEYGEEVLEIHKADLTAGKKWLIVDDLIATGGTLEAVAAMTEEQGAEVVGIFSIIGLPFLNYMDKIARYNPKTLINYNNE